MQSILYSINGCKTVPNVVAAGKYIGGGTEIETLNRQGKLKKILEQAGCTFAGKAAVQNN